MEVQSYAPRRSTQTAQFQKAMQLNYFAPDGAAAEAVAAARALLLKPRNSHNQALKTLDYSESYRGTELRSTYEKPTPDISDDFERVSHPSFRCSIAIVRAGAATILSIDNNITIVLKTSHVVTPQLLRPKQQEKSDQQS